MKAFFVKAMLPVAAFVLASAGAVGTEGKGTDGAGGTVQGWKRISPNVCEAKRICNNLAGPVCVFGTDDMYGKATPTSDCDFLLQHRP